jgi:rhamnosyltransferase
MGKTPEQSLQIANQQAVYSNLVTACIVIPTLNAARDWEGFAPTLLQWGSPDRVVIMDSSSDDDTERLAAQSGFRFVRIPRSEFNHGATRQLAVHLLPDAEVLVYLTQDTVLESPDAIHRLTDALQDHSIAAAYGRQLPRRAAGPIEAHARLFNYPETGGIRDLRSRERIGFKAIFISNSFAAYRRSALLQVGGFPVDVIFGEDTVTAARLLLAGWKIAYTPEACVRHSHDYTWIEEFKRYFDIGVLHQREGWLRQEFGQASGEGKKFVLSEITYLSLKAPLLIPSSIARTGLKLIGYRLGRLERYMTNGLKSRISMHRGFWSTE